MGRVERPVRLVRPATQIIRQQCHHNHLWEHTLENVANHSQQVREALGVAVRAADAKGATAPVALDVAEHFGLADVFLVLSGTVERNVQAISDEIEDEMNAAGIRTVRREGRGTGRWILLDFGDIIVHIFHSEERDFYQLERLWQDCPVIEIDSMLATQ